MPNISCAKSSLVILAIAFASSCGQGRADRGSTGVVRVAVAGNFAAPHEELARRFRAASGFEVETSIGSTGQLYAQIVNGAPYDVFLAADVDRPQRLAAGLLAGPESRFTYAVGRLALYAPTWDSVGSPEDELRTRRFAHLAIANPATAPYGAAAQSVLTRWGLWREFESRIVRAENVAQAFQFVESGAAEVGFVARSQVTDRDARHYAVLPSDWHQPIRQDAVLLRPGAGNPAARAFLRFLQSDEGREVITSFGYERP